MGRGDPARILLRLYPRAFRARFGAEWGENVAWHRRLLAGAPLASTRLWVRLSIDTVRNLPTAWGEAMGGSGRGARGGGWVRDGRYAWTSLVRSRGFTVAAVASVAFGIAVNTAIFSVVNGVLLRPLPYAEPERLAIVWNEFPGSGLQRLPLTGPQLQVLREEPDLFEGVAGVWSTSAQVRDGEGNASQVALGVVTPDFFDLLGVGAARGRLWARDDADGAAPRGVVLSDEAWHTRFGGDPAILEGTIDLNGQPVPVVGILPRGFTLFFPEDGAIPPRFDVYIALPWDLSILPPGQHYLRVVGRLRTSTDWTRAAAGVTAAGDRARERYAELQATGDRLSIHPLHADTVRASRPVLLALLAAVGLLLMLACTNVASLLLARTLARARELAIRASLGASGASLARLVVLESLMVTAAGAVLGVWCGRLGATALWSLRPAGMSRADALPLDLRVMGFSVLLSVAAGLAFALIALAAVRSLGASLGVRGGGGGGTGRAGARLRELLTAAEVAAGLVLVVGSALMVQSLGSLGRESVGFEPGNALTFRVSLPLGTFPTDLERDQIAAEIGRRLAGLPGVTAVGATSHLPFNEWANWGDAAPPRETPEAERSAYFADLRSVTLGYLPAIGAELVRGRFFDDRDGLEGAPVVVVDETMARRLFPGEDPLGRVIEPSRFTGGGFVPTAATIVGVIKDVRDRSPGRPSGGQVFWPFGQSPRWELTWYVRTDGDPGALADAVEREVRAVRPQLAPARVTPMATYVEAATGLTRFLALVGSVFSLLALALAAIGLYGVVAFVTVQRTHEIALRVVVGASRGEILRRVVGHGLRVGAAGVVAGLVGSLLLTRFMTSLVYGVSPKDPLTLVGVALILLCVAVAASLAPARRAARVDPVVALRG